MNYEPSDDALEKNAGAGIADKGLAPKLGEPRGVSLRALRNEAATARRAEVAILDDAEYGEGDFDVDEDVGDLRAKWNSKPEEPLHAATTPRAVVTTRGDAWRQFACSILAAGCADMSAVAKASDKLLELYEARKL